MINFNLYRIEYDAYRMDLENSKPEPTSPTTSEEAQRSFAKHKDNYEKLRADIAVKMQFLDENRVWIKIFKCKKTLYW